MHILLLAQGADLPSAWGVVQTGGIAGVLFLGLYLVFSGRIPTKQQLSQMNEQLTDMTADRDFWRNLALRGTNLVESHVQLSDEEMTMRLKMMESKMDGRLKGIETLLKDQVHEVQ